MQIHVVSKGQSVFNIATTYGTTVQAIVDANELETPNQLVVGQALVIPIMGHFYYVQPGDTLYAIARMFGLSTQELARVNNISIDRPLDVGFRLYIPAPQQKPPITSRSEEHTSELQS